MVDLLNHVEETPNQCHCSSVDWVRFAASEADDDEDEDEDEEGQDFFALVAKRQPEALPLAGGAQLYNNYGPRDTAAWMTHYGFIPAAVLPEPSSPNPRDTVTISLCAVEDSARHETQQQDGKRAQESDAPRRKRARRGNNRHADAGEGDDSVLGVLQQLREHLTRSAPQLSLGMLEGQRASCEMLPPQCRSLLRAARIHVATDAEFQWEYENKNPKSSNALLFAGPLCSRGSARRALRSASETPAADAGAVSVDVRALRCICRRLKEKSIVLQRVLDLDPGLGSKKSVVSQWALRQQQLVKRATIVFEDALSATLGACPGQGGT